MGKNLLILALGGLTFGLAGCTYSNPCYVYNSTEDSVSVIFDDQRHEIAPAETKRIDGLNLGSFILSTNKETLSYDYRSQKIDRSITYICGFRSSIHLEVGDSLSLELLPCDEAESRYSLVGESDAP